MFEEILPYSRKTIAIRPLYFKDAMNLARFIHEENYRGLARFIDDFFNIHDLHIVDKLFVCLIARKLFIDEKIRLKGKSNVDIQVQVLISRLSIEPTEQVFEQNGLRIVCDVPNKLHFTDVILDSIKSITALDTTIDFRNLDEDERDAILSKLSPSTVRCVHEFIKDSKSDITILPARPSLELNEITINLLSQDPLMLVRLIFSDYTLNYFRELIVILGKSIGVSMLEYSTLADAVFYLEEMQRDSSGKSDIEL
jgi:hypothetical protein